MILMLSASDYITSFGYQTNLMVYGPGEYANVDFFKFGSIMQILLWLSTTAMVSTLSIDNPKWVVSWIICAIGGQGGGQAHRRPVVAARGPRPRRDRPVKKAPHRTAPFGLLSINEYERDVYL
jgi:hypothetical protein